MGILDDAIREHLELKRQHGAESDDLERLEKEAFGAPARPGDPEFVDPDAASAAAPEAAVADVEAPPDAESTGGTSDWLVGEEETTIAPQAPVAEPDEPSPAEQAREEHAHLDDTAHHPAPDPEAEAAAEPPEAPERTIFDADFDDLELDEEDDGTVAPQAGEAEAPVTAEPEPEPLGDDEDFDLALDDPAGETTAPAPATEPLPPRESPAVPPEDDTDNPPLPVEQGEQEAEPDPEGEASDAEEGEDLLVETPDFLQDAPEGEDLWFEQGPPKDFDFDEDD